MSTYKVTLINESQGLNQTIDVPVDERILDAAEDAGVDLPSSCCAGICSTCTGKLISGTIEQDEQEFLDDKQKEAGFVLLCVAHATSDCTIQTHQQDALL